MILKFRIPVDQTRPGRQAWKMVDRLDSVVFCEGETSVDAIKANTGDGGGATCIYLHHYESEPDKVQKVNIVEATRDGNQYLKYVFSTEGYLCNDNGQTLERLIL